MAAHDPSAWRGNATAGSLWLLNRVFDAGKVTMLRHDVASCAAAAGLRDERLDDFVLAVYELLTNAVRHGGGDGLLRLWSSGSDVICEVSDGGSGFEAVPPADAERPALGVPGGWGLYLADKLTDSLTVTSGPQGTTVRLSTRLSNHTPAE